MWRSICTTEGRFVGYAIRMETFIYDTCCELYGLHVIFVEELNSYFDKNYYIEGLFEERRKQRCSKNGYVLKILNSEVSKDPAFIDGQNCMMQYLYQNGIQTPRPIPTISGSFYSVLKVPAIDDGDHVVRLLNFIPGTILHEIPYTANILYEVGKFAGKMDMLLKGFDHHSLRSHDTLWHPNTIPRLTDHLHYVTATNDRNLLRDILTSFTADIIPLHGKFQKGSIHGDFHDRNILAWSHITESKLSGNRNRPDSVVSAVLDLGESTSCYYVYEIAALLANIMHHPNKFEPFEAARHLLCGYMEEFTLHEVELYSLRKIICTRLAFLVIAGCRKKTENPTNSYACTIGKGSLEVMRVLWEKSDVDFLRTCHVAIETGLKD